MAHLARTSMIPPMTYVSELKRDELKTVKLKHVSGLVTKEKKVPVFNGKDGIEGLLYCEETVREAFEYLRVTDGVDLFNLYKETLAGSAVRKWNNVSGAIANNTRTVDRFNQAVKEFYKHYVDDKARNTMYDYLRTQDCGKPFKSTVYDHVDRMEELYRYSSKLPGTVPALDDNDPDDCEQIKEHIFSTFPERWQEAFEDAYYRTLWPRRSHVLAPLTALTGKRKFDWNDACTKAFEEMKAIMSSDVLMRYPNHNLPFEIYTDASDYQMGAVIVQDGHPVAYWSRKFNDAQTNYGTIEKELLAVVECLKEFRTMLLGADLTVYTDHRNLTFRTLNTQRVLRWRLSLEDFAPTFRYIQGKDNVLADCFSRLPTMSKPSEGKSAAKIATRGKLVAFDTLKVPPLPDEAYSYEATVPAPSEDEINKGMPCLFSCCRDKEVTDDDEMFDTYLNHPPLEAKRNPITLRTIQQEQFEDESLNQRRQREPYRFPVKRLGNRDIICFREGPNPDQWVIALPTRLIDEVIIWYHKVLGHPGNDLLYKTIRGRFYAPGLWKRCDSYCCTTCQLNKQVGSMGYGHLPPREAQLTPWSEVASDLIGPWTITLQDGRELKFSALTSIDLATNLTEMIRIENKTASHVSTMFERMWLNRYPKPNRCIHDNGGEFKGEWITLMERVGIDNVPTTPRNPQANAICERMHQTVGNLLRTTFNDGRIRPPTHAAAKSAVDDALSTAMHVMRCTVSKALNDNTPGSIAFNRDMLLDIPVIADLETIRNNRQAAIDNNLIRQNSKRHNFDYAVGGEVLIKTDEPTKMQQRAHGPYTITRVYSNGTVDVRKNPHVTERINIRKLIPFKRWHR